MRGAAGAIVAVMVIGGCSPTPSEDSTPSRSEPSYSRSEYPSGLVVRTAERDIDLPADTSCWTGTDKCRRGLLMPDDPVPNVGSGEAIEFWFARPDWKFSATFRGAAEDCPRATTIDATRTDDQWFRLTPADKKGRYEVDLYGEGPEGSVSARFVWTTTSNGPVDPPEGAVALFPDSLGEGSFGLEVTLDDLAFQPAVSELSPSVDVTVRDARAQERSLAAPLIPASLTCGSRGNRGSFFYQMEWKDDFSVLGRRPFDLEVGLMIRGTTYIGRATWRGADGQSAYTPLTFTPALPAAAFGR